MSKTLQQWLSSQEIIPTKYTGDGLANMVKVASALNILGMLKNKFVITVGGTNGKGSCVAFLETILLAANYRVGTYTSPHLINYNERIRINGANIDDDTLCTAFNTIENARKSVPKQNKIAKNHIIDPSNSIYSEARPQQTSEVYKHIHEHREQEQQTSFQLNSDEDTPLTYFELATLAALWIFNQHSLDVLILEVGLGGRLDATNIIDPDIAIITTISLDHTQQLGDNREAIAREKAGIMRPHKPAICGDFAPPPSIYQHAEKIAAQLYCINKEFHYFMQDNSWEWTGKWQHKNIMLTKLPIPHLPIQNAAIALMAITLMQQQPQQRFTIPTQAINEGLQKAFLAGRFQTIQFHGLQIILDVAHNPASANLLAHNLKLTQSSSHTHRQTLFVTSMLKDKDIALTFQELKDIADKWYIGTLHHARAASKQQLQEAIVTINPKQVSYYDSVIEAFKAAISTCNKHANKHDRIVVFGSFYIVAEVLKFVKSKQLGQT